MLALVPPQQGLWACSSEPLRARLLAFAGVLVVVCATWLQLLIGSKCAACTDELAWTSHLGPHSERPAGCASSITTPLASFTCLAAVQAAALPCLPAAGPIPAVAVLKSISFILSCLAALAVLGLLALMRLEAPPRRSAGGDTESAGAGAEGLEASAASEEGGGGRWWLTLLPAAAGSEAEGREVAGAAMSPAAAEGQ